MLFANEKVEDVLEEVYPLLELHYQEAESKKAETVPFEPNLDLYLQMDSAGVVRLYTMRDEDGKLHGYNLFFLTPHPHTMSIHFAQNNILYIHPDSRHTEATVNFLNFCEKNLNKEGVDEIMYNMKVGKTFMTLMNMLGFEHTEQVYTKRLDQ